jgi:thioredoxin-related protein
MKWPFGPGAAAIVTIAAMATSPSSAWAEIRWEKDLKQASRAALQTNRVMLLEFWSATCGPCESMDATVFPDQRVAAAMNRVVPVRVDVDNDPVSMRKYGVPGTPTLLVADSYGNELFRYTGLLTRDQMLRFLEELPAEIPAINQLTSTLAQKKDDLATLRTLGHELRAAKFYRASNTYFARALRTRAAAQQPDARADILLAAAKNCIALKATAEAARMLEQCIRDHKGTSQATEAARLIAELR